MNLANDFTFSQSSLQSYLNCQYQFYLKYMRQLDWPSALLDPWNPAEIERQSGIRFHQLVYNHFLGVPEFELMKHASEDPNPKMAEWLENFKNSIFFNQEDTVFTELSVQTTLARYRFSAKYDLLVLREKEIHIFDWKTSKRPPKSEWLRKRIQTQLYPLLARSTYQQKFSGHKNPTIIFTYWEASYPTETIEFVFDDNELQIAQASILRLAEEIVSKPVESFRRTDRIERCSYCLFRSYCQRPTTDSYNIELEHELLFAEQDLVSEPEKN